MGLIINTNVASLVAQQNLNVSNSQLKLNVQRLSSGYRVNSASDDAAGLARADQLRANSRGLQAALRNSNDGVSALEIADKSAEQITLILTRMNELAILAAQGTLDTVERGYYDVEWKQLQEEINRISNVTEFDGKKLLNANLQIDLQIGFRNVAANDRLQMSMANLLGSTLGVEGLTTIGGSLSLVAISTQAKAQDAIDFVKNAIKTINDTRARFGAYTNRLQATVSNLQVTFTNFQAAESRIRDVDFANETASFTKNQILVQSGVSVLAQANSLPQAALTLLR